MPVSCCTRRTRELGRGGTLDLRCGGADGCFTSAGVLFAGGAPDAAGPGPVKALNAVIPGVSDVSVGCLDRWATGGGAGVESPTCTIL
jgi:hypothetical protein